MRLARQAAAVQGRDHYPPPTGCWNDAEVFAFWRATDPARYPEPASAKERRAGDRLEFPAGEFYRLLLLTGVRLNELNGARWSEFTPALRQKLREGAGANGAPIDWGAVPGAAKLWSVPRERFKSDTEHRVPLSDDALAILERLHRRRVAKSDLVFTLDGDKPIWIGTKTKKRLDSQMLGTLRALARARGEDPKAVKLTPWINHDLRRVVRTT